MHTVVSHRFHMTGTRHISHPLRRLRHRHQLGTNSGQWINNFDRFFVLFQVLATREKVERSLCRLSSLLQQMYKQNATQGQQASATTTAASGQPDYTKAWEEYFKVIFCHVSFYFLQNCIGLRIGQEGSFIMGSFSVSL